MPDGIMEAPHRKAILKRGASVDGLPALRQIPDTKFLGEGRFTDREDRQAAMKFAFKNAGGDAVTVGYKNTSEIDEAIENLNQALV